MEENFGLIDMTIITKSRLQCRYCGEHVEGNTDSELLLEMIYHVYENHMNKNIEKWDVRL